MEWVSHVIEIVALCGLCIKSFSMTRDASAQHAA